VPKLTSVDEGVLQLVTRMEDRAAAPIIAVKVASGFWSAAIGKDRCFIATIAAENALRGAAAR
jgi:hypothetical protein